jgi:hypothetical protein
MEKGLNAMIPPDTTEEMQEFQRQLIMSKTPEERFLMGIEMTEMGRQLMLAGIKNEKPGLTDEQYKIELLKRMIQHDNSLSWLESEI